MDATLTITAISPGLINVHVAMTALNGTCVDFDMGLYPTTTSQDFVTRYTGVSYFADSIQDGVKAFMKADLDWWKTNAFETIRSAVGVAVEPYFDEMNTARIQSTRQWKEIGSASISVMMREPTILEGLTQRVLDDTRRADDDGDASMVVVMRFYYGDRNLYGGGDGTTHKRCEYADEQLTAMGLLVPSEMRGADVRSCTTRLGDEVWARVWDAVRPRCAGCNEPATLRIGDVPSCGHC